MAHNLMPSLPCCGSCQNVLRVLFAIHTKAKKKKTLFASVESRVFLLKAAPCRRFLSHVRSSSAGCIDTQMTALFVNVCLADIMNLLSIIFYYHV
jgi:hypothetical protein